MAEVDDPVVGPDGEAPETGQTLCRDIEDLLDADDLALISLGSGIVATVFVMCGYGTWLLPVSFLLGIGAVCSGWKAYKRKTKLERQAIYGLGFGCFALALYLVMAVVQCAARLFG